MTVNKNIFKINRHLFDKWDLQTKQGIAEQSPKGFDSPFTLVVMLWIAPDFESVNKKMKDRAEMLKPKLSLQHKGYRLDKSSILNLCSLSFGVLHLFNLTNLNSI